MKWAEKPKTTPLTHNKLETPEFFFNADAKTWQMFEGLNSSLTQSSVEIFPCKNTCQLLDFSPSLP